MVNPDIQIVEATPSHIADLAANTNTRLMEMALRLGLSPKKALWYSYRHSFTRRTAFINGKIAAMWGCSGAPLGQIGSPWLVMSPEIEQHPFRVAFVYRKELQRMQQRFSILEDWVDETYDKAVRMLEIMGFVKTDQVMEHAGMRLRLMRRVT